MKDTMANRMGSMYLAAILVVAALLGCSVNGFAVRPVGNHPSSLLEARQPSTCLFSTEGGEDQESPPPPEEEGGEEPEVKTEAENDILNSPAFLTRKLQVLQSDIAKAEEDLTAAKERLRLGKEEWGPQLEDLQKEYKNIQDRMNARSKQGNNMATTQVARQMLTALDIYDRAFGVITAETDKDREIEAAYRANYDKILSVLGELGVEEVETVGTEFDFEVHQAVMQRPSDEYEEGIVCEELQKGFKIGDTLIRPAMVSVAA